MLCLQTKMRLAQTFVATINLKGMFMFVIAVSRLKNYIQVRTEFSRENAIVEEWYQAPFSPANIR